MGLVTNNLRLEAELRDLALAEPFTIATKTYESAQCLLVKVRQGDELGVGEVAPESRWNETPQGSLAEVTNVDLGRLGGPFDLEGVLELMPASSARCALDVALHDLAATLMGVSVLELIGAAGRTLPETSVTVPINDVPTMVERARSLSDHPILKLKVGFEGDVQAVAAIRDVYQGTIRIDANEGWDADTAIERLKALEAYDIELCEQPIERKHLEDLRRVTGSTSIPIYADEDANTSGDVPELAGAVDGVNLKLRKTGGIREAIRAIAVARAHGLGVMIGCDLTSGILATAEASVAALCDKADVDGPLLLAKDPNPGVSYDRGRLTLPEGPGLGVANKT